MDKKLVISRKKYSGHSNVVSMRLPREIIDQIDEICEKTGRTRNDVIQKCLEFSLENIVLEDNKDN